MSVEAARLFGKVLLAKKKVRIKPLGDSITHGVGGTGFEQNGKRILATFDFKRNPDGYCWANLFKDYMEKQFNCEVVNNGITGQNIEFVIEHLDIFIQM